VESCAIWQNRQKRNGLEWNKQKLLRKRDRKNRKDVGYNGKNKRKDLGRRLKRQKDSESSRKKRNNSENLD